MTVVPPVRRDPLARSTIRDFNRRTGRRVAVLDDDPTGSQSVHDVEVITEPAPAAYQAALAEPGSVAFILTNSRGLVESRARTLTRSITIDLAATPGLELVSRSDSCLRGHVIAEMEEMAAVLGPIDGILFVPALFGAGRYTRDDVHYAVLDGVETPVGHTEFARDETFGYRSSNLRSFLQEKSAGAIWAGDVLSVSIQDIRVGGPDRVAAVLDSASNGQWIVINALADEDLDTVVLGLQQAQTAGRRFLYRCGPSFVRALAGIEPRPALQPQDIVIPAGRARSGLVVVGSHTALTTAQLRELQSRTGIQSFELDVGRLADPLEGAMQLDELTAAVSAALTAGDVLINTSRGVATGPDREVSLAIARRVSADLVELVRRVRDRRPAWVVAKGGITANDIAVQALGIRRARVIGQFPPGSVSLFSPVEAPAEVLGLPFVVFPGNTGTSGTLAEIVASLRQAARSG